MRNAAIQFEPRAARVSELCPCFLFRAGGSFPCDEEMLAATIQHLQNPNGTFELTAAQQEYAIKLGSKVRFWNDIVSMAEKSIHIAIARGQLTASSSETVPQ